MVKGGLWGVTLSVRPLKEKLQKGQEGPSSTEESVGSDFSEAAEVVRSCISNGMSSVSDLTGFASS